MRRFLTSLSFLFLAASASADQGTSIRGPVRTYFSSCTAQVPLTVNVTASGDTVAISSPAASVRLIIKKISVHNAGSANVTVSLKDGGGGTTYWKGELASEGGAAGISFGNIGWKLSFNTNLVVSLSAAGDVDVNVMDYCKDP